MNSMQIAEAIIAQMGGFMRLKTMINAKVSVVDRGVKITHMRGAQSIKAVTITLNGKDLYDLSFINTRNRVVNSANDVYNSDLRGVFEDVTGLYLSL